MTTRHLTPFLLFAIVGLLPLVADAQVVSYTFTKLVDTTSVGEFGDCGAPALNDAGTVAFECSAPPTFEGTLFRSDGTTITTIGKGPFGLCGVAPSINKHGEVAFINCEGVFVGEGGPPRLIVARPGGFGETAAVSINDHGAVAFQRFDGVFVAVRNAITTIADRTGRFPGTFAFCDIFECASPAINKRGQVAFWTAFGVFVGDADSNIRAIALGDFRLTDPTINDKGTVAFVARRSTSEEAILVGSSTSLSTLVDTATGLFNALFFPSINNRGTVAFTAYLNEFHNFGIFTGPDPATDRVVVTGDTLFGSIVTGVEFFRGGLNSSGQVAFSARFADRTSAIVLADPVYACTVLASDDVRGAGGDERRKCAGIARVHSGSRRHRDRR